jgi:hypothetical protein
MDAKTFEARTRKNMNRLIRRCRESLAYMDSVQVTHPDWPPVDRGQFLVPLAGAEMVLQSLDNGVMRRCLDAGQPIPETELHYLRTLGDE